MAARPAPQRHWRGYGNDPLPTPAEALAEPFAAFPSWFLRITCDRCGKDRMVNESHTPWRDRALRDILKRMRHGVRGSSISAAESAPRQLASLPNGVASLQGPSARLGALRPICTADPRLWRVSQEVRRTAPAGDYFDAAPLPAELCLLSNKEG